MEEAPPPSTVHGPQWFRDAYLLICHEINRLDGVITVMQDAREDPERNAPDLCKAYNMLLWQQHLLFDQQAEALSTAQRQDFMQFETASTQFAEEDRLAIKYSEMTAKARAQDAGKEMLKHGSTLAQHNADQFSRVEAWAKVQELARKSWRIRWQRGSLEMGRWWMSSGGIWKFEKSRQPPRRRRKRWHFKSETGLVQGPEGWRKRH